MNYITKMDNKNLLIFLLLELNNSSSVIRNRPVFNFFLMVNFYYIIVYNKIFDLEISITEGF